MNFTDKLSINLNDDFFSDKVLFQSKENPTTNLSNNLQCLDKSREQIIYEVAQRAKKVFNFD